MLISIRLFLRAGGWMVIILLIILAVIVPQFVKNQSTSRALASYGTQISAQVTGRDVQQKFSGGAWYFLDYTFAPPGRSKVYIRHQEVTADIHANSQIGSMITVVFLPQTPKVAHADPHNLGRGSWLSVGAIVIVLLSAVLLGYRAFTQAKVAFRARQNIRGRAKGVIVKRRIIRLISEVDFTQLPAGSHPTYRSFPRIFWGHKAMRDGTLVSLALSDAGAFLWEDLLLPRGYAP